MPVVPVAVWPYSLQHALEGVDQCNKGSEMYDPASAARKAIFNFEDSDFANADSSSSGYWHHGFKQCTEYNQMHPVAYAATTSAKAHLQK